MNRVKALRESFGKTLRDIEAETGIARSSLQRIEAEVGEPSYYSIERLADYYHVSVDYLMMHDLTRAKGKLTNEVMKAVEARLEIQRLMSEIPTETDAQLKPMTTKPRLPKKRSNDLQLTQKGIKPRERFKLKDHP